MYLSSSISNLRQGKLSKQRDNCLISYQSSSRNLHKNSLNPAKGEIASINENNRWILMNHPKSFIFFDAIPKFSCLFYRWNRLILPPKHTFIYFNMQQQLWRIWQSKFLCNYMQINHFMNYVNLFWDVFAFWFLEREQWRDLKGDEPCFWKK